MNITIVSIITLINGKISLNGLLKTEIYYKDETDLQIRDNLFSIYGKNYRVICNLKATNAQFQPINNINP